MARNKSHTKYKIVDTVKKLVIKDAVLVTKLGEEVGTEPFGVYRMLDRDSQTLVGVNVLELLKTEFDKPISELYEKIEA